MSDDPPNILPGAEIEKAAAGVLSEAGKGFVKTVKKVADSWFVKGISRREAEASEIRENIIHDGKIARESKSIEMRRIQEIAEVEHRLELLHRALGRLSFDLESGQEKIERVIEAAAAKIEEDADSDSPREIDPDWLRRFFNYVSEVDEERVLNILADALADSAISERPVIPAKALDTLRFFTKKSYDDFFDVASLMGKFGFLDGNIIESSRKLYGNLDIAVLEELGLIKKVSSYFKNIRIGNLFITVSYDSGTIYRFETLDLTSAGLAIVRLINKDIWALNAHSGDINFTEELAVLQQEMGISKKDVITLANSIISSTCDAVNVEIDVKQINDRRIRNVLKVERRSSTEPYALRDHLNIDPSFGLDPLFLSFIDTFEDFDANTLNSLIRRD